MTSGRRNLIVLLATIASMAVNNNPTRELVASDDSFFESKIRPILVLHCYKCHSHAVDPPKGGLQLDWRDGLLTGGDSGAAVVPGNLTESLLLDALRHETFKMPPDKKLPDSVVRDFEKWILEGARDPRKTPPDTETIARETWQATVTQRGKWWSLRSVSQPSVPVAAGAEQPIDRYIQSRLAKHDLSPAPAADRRTLARRLSYTLLGLPPDPDRVNAFARDNSPLAHHRLVDEMLSSPHFGERWARHWMDVVRYADTYGYEWDIPAKGAWRYRDYLVRAFNQDLPFDQMVREQIAGDLLTTPRINQHEGINESVLGTMFYQLGEKRHGDSSEFNGIHQEMLDNKIDAFSKAFQATTIACARCHDHKLDPVAQDEYYALGGMFMSSRWVTNTADLPQRNAVVIAELKEIKRHLRPLIAANWALEANQVNQHLQQVAQAVGPIDTAWYRAIDKRRKQEKIPYEDPLRLWCHVTNREESTIASKWREEVAEYQRELAKRRSENATHFRFTIDFREGIPDGWSVDGVGLREITARGDFVVSLNGNRAVDQILAGGLFTYALSPRLNGAVRTPYTSAFKNGHISFLGCGGDFAAHRTVFDNAFLTEKQKFLANDRPHWTLLTTHHNQTRHRVYLEFATKTSNPNFPPRVGLGGVCSDEQIADPRSWFGLTQAVFHEAGHTPLNELKPFDSLLKTRTPESLDELCGAYSAWLGQAITAWAEDCATDSQLELVQWLLDERLLTNAIQPGGSENEKAINHLVQQYRHTEERLKTPWTINGMRDLDAGFNYRLNVRGDYDDLGDAIPRRYLDVLYADQPKVPDDQSGRQELAEMIADPQNPLTARVFVNRTWQWLFGSAIVQTSNDFGHLGSAPSHPELLDYLSWRFTRAPSQGGWGWSPKALVREIVMSETWQQSDKVTAAARELDPTNRLLHHYAVRRLEGEAIRDAILSVSGTLDHQIGGRPINPPRANEDGKKRLFSGPLDGHGRRSIYTKVTIMEPPRLLATFNQPDPKIPTGRRDMTSTPSQSLALLNDPFIVDQATRWGERISRRSDLDLPGRLTLIFHAAYGRPPLDHESNRWREAFDQIAALARLDPDTALDEPTVWKEMAHSIFNTKEFIYIR